MKKFLLFFTIFFCVSSIHAQTTATPLNMTLHAQWDADTLPTAGSREYNDIWGWVDCAQNEYAIIGSSAYIHFFDVTDPDNINELGFFAGGQVSIWRDMKTYRDRAYAVSENTNEGLMIFDLSNIQDTIIKSFHSNTFFNSAHNIFVDNDNGRLYAVGTNTQSQGLIILDIETDPDNPILLASVNLPGGGYVHDMYVKDNIGYCSHGYNGFYIWDLTDPLNPVYIADFSTSGYNHSSWLTDDGNYIVYAEEVPLGLPLGVLDVSDMSNGNISAVSTFKFPLLAPDHMNNVPHNPFIRGDYAIVSHYHDGIQIFDISNPQNPSQVAYYDSHANDSYSGYSGCWGVYPFLPSGTIIASDINEGLLVLTADSITLAPVSTKSSPDATLSNNIPSPFCEGDGGLLQVPDGAEAYTWYKDGAVVANNQSFYIPEASGEYYVEVSNGHCSAYSEIATITLNPSPDLSNFPVGTFSFCEFSEYLIEAPSGMDSYLWLLDGEIVQQGGNEYIGSAAGTLNLTVTLGPCSSTSENIILELLPSPSPNILNSDASFCEGSNYTLETEPGNSSYDWYKDNNFLATTIEPFYTISEGGDYSVEALLGACSGSSPIYTVNAEALPDTEILLSGSTISEDDDSALICEGSSVSLAVVLDANANYEWIYNGNPIGTNSNILEVNTPGNYSVLVTNSSGCVNESTLFEIALSFVSAEITFENGILSESSPASSYQWYLNGNLINGANAMDYSPMENGDYYCNITNSDGCIASSNTINVILNGAYGIESIDQLTLFPNPTDGRLTLQIEVDQSTNFDIEIIQLDGRVVQFVNQNVHGNTTIALDLEDLSSGIYFLKLKNEEGQEVRKIVKQ